MAYLRKETPASGPDSAGCIFCDLPAESDDAASLIIQRGQWAYVILNRYPYNNGHMMVVPYEHVPSFEHLAPPALAEIMELSNQCVAALRAIYDPQAFNLGANIGAAAGAGIADHVHMHVVPRWSGDTNFMPVLADVRVLPEHLLESARRLRAAWSG